MESESLGILPCDASELPAHPTTQLLIWKSSAHRVALSYGGKRAHQRMLDWGAFCNAPKVLREV